MEDQPTGLLDPAIRHLAKISWAAMLAAPVLFHAVQTAAQESSGVMDTQVGQLGSTTKNSNVGFRRGSVVVAPIPFSNPTIGTGLILGAGYLFQFDEGSKPSVIGGAAMRTDNGSMAGGLAVNLNFDDNRWILKALLAQADVKYDLYTDIGILPIQQEGVLGRLAFAYGVTQDLSFGLSFRYLDTVINLSEPGFPPIPPPFDQFLDVKIANVGVVSEWDNRDDSIYPSSGHHLQFQAYKGYALSGLVEDYAKSYANYTFYLSPAAQTVVATRLSICGASSATPFFDQCGLGTVDAFRGFPATQYLDLRSASAQIEIRQRLTKRIGAVAFGGVGQAGRSFSQLDDNGSHSAIGVGVRYRVSKKFPLDFSIDVAHNDESENNLYIYVGQRF